MSNIDHGFNVEVLSLSDTTLISSGTFNPAITGFDAPAGSIFLYKNLSQGHAFLKTGPNNTDWTELKSDIIGLILLPEKLKNTAELIGSQQAA